MAPLDKGQRKTMRAAADQPSLKSFVLAPARYGRSTLTLAVTPALAGAQPWKPSRALASGVLPAFFVPR
jgi:hypothetical protein